MSFAMCTYTCDQVTERARCKISNKGYLSLNIFVILCHNMVIRSWDITTIPRGLSETFFGRFQQTISCDCVCEILDYSTDSN